MGFFVKKSLVFLLAILLICASYANGDLPEASAKDRKLLSLGKVVLNTFKSTPRTLRKTEPPAGVGNRKHLGKTPDGGKGSRDELFITRFWNNQENEIMTTLTENVAKYAGEEITRMLFGLKGKRGFRYGWKAGKLYYSIERKCEKLNKLLKCENSTPSTLPCSNNRLPYCLAEIEGPYPISTTLPGPGRANPRNYNNLTSCTQTCFPPPETGCDYLKQYHSNPHCLPSN